MTRKDYVLIAEALKDARQEALAGVIGRDATFGADKAAKTAALFIAARLRSTNPKFDRGRFLRACGVEG